MVPPPAARVTRAGWRDPRLWIGVLLVAGSVVLGARVLAAADDSVAVWALAGDVGPGTVLDEGDLVAVRVGFADDTDLDRYLPTDEALPEGALLVRGLGAGELLPRAALGDANAAGTVRLPLDVEPHRVPPTVDVGSVVDVWVGVAGSGSGPGTGRGTGPGAGPGASAPTDPAAGPALAAVTVVDAPPADESIAVSGTRQLVLAVADDQVGPFLALLDGTDEPAVRVVQRS
ncbi:hypothetical protein [Nocardioides sp. TF02-7]|uniref:hypothetical protein n=1 Tax=Nocardioides sp. TF02-7 TaxID=2917724 RepID=UPI001F069B08|nr:hypothetical protein [Nocardioides sp. TF02-7]UMG91771.1 hypothetical protein MF408_17170 [Nocardioides sp. TF02-7]